MAVVRQMAFSYGGQAVPGTLAGASLRLHSVHQLRRDVRAGVAECVFYVVVLSPDAPTHAAACEAFEAQFTKRRQAFFVSLNGVIAFALSDADNTGFEVAAEVSKPGDTDEVERWDTNTSRLYEVRVTAGLPAGDDAENRRELSYTVAFTESRRMSLSVSGVYTAQESPPLTATAAYEFGAPARIQTIITALGGVWEQVGEDYTPDDQDQVLEFTQTWAEIVADQFTGGVNSPALVNPSLSVRRLEEQDPQSESGDPLLVMEATYDAGVDRDTSVSLLSAWEDIALPTILEAMEIFAKGGVGVTSVQPSFDVYEHRIAGVVRGQAVSESTNLSTVKDSVDEIDYGKIIRPTWPKASDVPDDEENDEPKPTPAYVYQGPRVIIRTTTKRTETLSAFAISGAANRNARSIDTEQLGDKPKEEGNGNAGGDSFLVVRTNKRVGKSTESRGIDRFGALTVNVKEEVETFRLIIAVASEGSTQAGLDPTTTRTRNTSGGGRDFIGG